jgi:pyruvate kinase
MEEARTKIICTIGPASSSVSMLLKMIYAGMDVARLNFSHGTHDEHKTLIRNIRRAASTNNKYVGILQDLQGPKIRVGDLPKDGVKLSKSQKIVFTTASSDFEKTGDIQITHPTLHKDIKKGHRIFLDDGRIEAEVLSVRGRKIFTKVVLAGVLLSNKGINLPDSSVSGSSFTKKDEEDLLFGLQQGVDWIALSFVSNAKTIERVRKLIKEKCRYLGTTPPRIISKIERREALDRFEEIMGASDAIMLARGDLGVEINPEQVPIVQKEVIELCRQSGKPVVVATHMLDSMTKSPRATRAETSDVANAVIDHADAVMLSAESATGDYPDKTVQTMNTVIAEAENSRFDDIGFYQIHDIEDIETSIAQTLHVMSRNDQIDVIATSSTYGCVTEAINMFRPDAKIILACPNKTVARQMAMRSGVTPIVLSDAPGTFLHRMESKMRKDRLVFSKQRVAYVTKAPHGVIQLTIK